MGMDLTLYPHKEKIQHWRSMVGSSFLHLDQDYGLFAQIDRGVMGDAGGDVKQVCKPKPLPPNVEFMTYDDDDGIKEMRTDKYGEGLTYVEAWELKKVKLDPESSDWNKAIFAMIKAIPDAYPVVLMWR
jgi:hypothetical protein